MDFAVECITAQEFVEFREENGGELTFVGDSIKGQAFAMMEGNNGAYIAFVILNDGRICPVAAGQGKYVPLVNGEPA